MHIIMNFLSRDDSAAAVEYGLLLALIALAAFVALSDVGDRLKIVFGRAGGLGEGVP